MSNREMLGINISPSVVEFVDAEADVLHQMKISVQNLGKISRNIRFLAPETNKFHLQCKDFDKTIAPGLELVGLVEYFNSKEEDCQDCIVFMIDDKFVEVPIYSYAPKSTLIVDGLVDFGITVADGKVHTKEISILNHGTKNGTYRILVEKDLPFHIAPLSSTIQAGYSQPIRVEFISKDIGDIDVHVSVELEGQVNGAINVKARVVPRALVLLDTTSENRIERIQFGCTYYGTDVVRQCWLYNASPESSQFVTILQDDGEGKEMGIDLTRSVTDVCVQPKHHGESDINSLSSLISVTPHEGVLKPYEKRKIVLKFSPRLVKPRTGWTARELLSSRRDFALFIKIQMVGLNMDESDMNVEVALTGTALPVFLSILPSTSVEFKTCLVGKKEDLTLKLRNDSPDLPVAFTVQTSAHFRVQPICGILAISEIKDLVLSFQPNQVGVFRKKIIIDVIGQQCVIETKSKPVFKKAVIETHIIQVFGECPSVVGKIYPVSYMQSESGIPIIDTVTDTDDISLKVFYSNKNAESLESNYKRDHQLSMVTSTKRECQYKLDEKLPVRVAQYDDLAASIRPSNKHEHYRTRFTRKDRYHYIDPDYSHTIEETNRIAEHKAKYDSYLKVEKEKRTYKKQAREFAKLNNDIDLGMKPGHGLKPPNITVQEIKDSESQHKECGRNTEKNKRLLSSEIVNKKRNLTARKKVLKGLKAVPTTPSEKQDCSTLLTPQELFQIVLEPQILDFGDVCCRSVCTKNFNVTNNNDTTIMFQVDINCRELRQTSPLSQVIPPGHAANVEFIFESPTFGKYEWSINYSINTHHKGHIVIHANVIPVGLELSENSLLLEPIFGMAVETGFRKCVTLINKRNLAAEFTWSPVITKEGTSFTIRPAKGVVEAYSTLDCEVTFYPSFSSCFTGEFVVRVQQGNEMHLSCKAKTGLTSCSFVERRLMLGAISLNMTTTRVAFLKNTSVNHAYFKIVNASPIHGMFISPKEGVVPVGGTTEIMVLYKPDVIHKFDTEVEIEVRNWKKMKLRIGGRVEIPSVDVDVENFQFRGVYGGATASIPFKITNLGNADAHVIFNFSSYRDFKINFHNKDDTIYSEEDGIFCVLVPGQRFINTSLEFTPTEVAMYDFLLPVSVNHILPPSPPPSPYPASVATTRSVATLSPTVRSEPSGQVFEIVTPRRRVQATGLRSQLQLSTKCLQFSLPSGYYDLNVSEFAGRLKTIVFVNNSGEKLSWSLDIASCKTLFDAGVFRFLYKNGSLCDNECHDENEIIEMDSGQTFELKVVFNPVEPGTYKATVPVILNNENMQLYTKIELAGSFEAPMIRFEPAVIEMRAVPLDTSTEEQVRIVATGFKRDAKVEVRLPDVEVDDGSVLPLFTCNMVGGDIIRQTTLLTKIEKSSTLTCQIIFKSPKPVSYVGEIIFIVNDQSYVLPVNATADNCLLTTYNFLANTQNNLHIVCERIKEKKVNQLDLSTDTIFVPCVSPIRTPTCVSMVTNSTSFSFHASSYEDSSLASSTPLSRNTMTFERHRDKDELVLPYLYEDNYLASSTTDGKFLMEVSRTVQRWYSSLCWPLGLSTINLHRTLRQCLTTSNHGNYGNSINGSNRAGTLSREDRKETKSIVDVVASLCGKPVPGIPLNLSLPNGRDERLKTILWLYSTLLTFLRCQGAMVSCIRPEFLLDAEDFMYYMKTRPSENGDSDLADDQYEVLSRKKWNDLLLQILKVLYLARVTPQSLKNIVWPVTYSSFPAFTQDPLCSNVYGLSERIILAWLSHHYEEQRTRFWKKILKDNEPTSRWIVNFEKDLADGLVIAALLAAHAPYLIKSHLRLMYTHPNSAEQCLHNALKVVEVFRFLGLEVDVLATDITEPNAIAMLLLCVHLFQSLPQYTPKSKVEMIGPLHATVKKYIKLQNPSSKALIYQAVIAGEYGKFFSLPTGDRIEVPAKGEFHLPVECKSRFLSPCEGTLILIGRRAGSAVGSTLVFTLRCSVNTIVPQETIKCLGLCYELKEIRIPVNNPFDRGGTFKILIVETITNELNQSLTIIKKNRKKKTTSKIDHGNTKKTSSPLPEVPNKLLQVTKDATNTPVLSSFWLPCNEIALEPNTTRYVHLHYLPFDIGERQCSVLFINKDIGEFLYSIEAEAALPLPCEVPFYQGSNGRRVTSARASHDSRGILKADSTTVYLHCQAEVESVEELQLPVYNPAKERALVIAAQQKMSAKELKRREMSGVLSSETIVSAIESLQLNDTYKAKLPAADVLGVNGPLRMFTVELTSPYFKAPETVCMATTMDGKKDEEMVKLPLTILPCKPGQYSCKIIMKSLHDIRVYQIECTIKHDGIHVELEFETPTNEAVYQQVPIANHSDSDWNFQVELAGEGFSGPSSFKTAASSTSYYPLQFKPVYEGPVEGHLVLSNRSNGAENVFLLKGLGTKPLPLDTVKIDCIVNEPSMKVLEVTNTLNHKMVFQTFSDLDVISGPTFITVLPRLTVQVPIQILTKKRGQFQGKLVFIYDKEFVERTGIGRAVHVDSDEDSEDDDTTMHWTNTLACSAPSGFSDLKETQNFRKPYRVWYEIHINSIPLKAEKHLEMTSPVYSPSSMELVLSNPLVTELSLDVTINGLEIYGAPAVVIQPGSSVLYQLEYRPTVVGKSKASVIFNSEVCAEFWYDITLTGEEAEPKTLPIMQCVVGRSCVQSLTLQNPSVDPVTYSISCSNTNNFVVDSCNSGHVTVPALSQMEVDISFHPTAIGRGKHEAQIAFYNKQAGTHTYFVFGIGDPPLTNTDHVIYTGLGSNSSTIIIYKNPFDYDVIVNVILQQVPVFGNVSEMELDEDESEFSLLLKQRTNLIIPSKALLEIPVSYTPDSMRKQDIECCVITKRFPQEERVINFNEFEVKWRYIVQGIPVSTPLPASRAPIIKCRARERFEERIEISFTGVDDDVARTTHSDLMKALSPVHLLGNYVPSSSVDEDHLHVADDFTHDFEYDDVDAQSDISRSVAVKLKRKVKNKITGINSLLFEVILSPSKTFDHLVYMTITSSKGGLWKYPLRFTSTEPVSDDVIVIESAGLNKESSISFRLNSQTSEECQYEAFFAAGSDDMFKVNPSSGMLSPNNDAGTLFTVTYQPTYYGKVHQAKLLIQTRDVQWVYDIKGTTPNYQPPQATSTVESHRLLYQSSRKKNFVKNNIRLLHTGGNPSFKRGAVILKDRI